MSQIEQIAETKIAKSSWKDRLTTLQRGLLLRIHEMQEDLKSYGILLAAGIEHEFSFTHPTGENTPRRFEVELLSFFKKNPQLTFEAAELLNFRKSAYIENIHRENGQNAFELVIGRKNFDDDFDMRDSDKDFVSIIKKRSPRNIAHVGAIAKDLISEHSRELLGMDAKFLAMDAKFLAIEEKSNINSTTLQYNISAWSTYGTNILSTHTGNNFWQYAAKECLEAQKLFASLSMISDRSVDQFFYGRNAADKIRLHISEKNTKQGSLNFRDSDDSLKARLEFRFTGGDTCPIEQGFVAVAGFWLAAKKYLDKGSAVIRESMADKFPEYPIPRNKIDIERSYNELKNSELALSIIGSKKLMNDLIGSHKKNIDSISK